jgi:S1-C subfamily serine protease
MSRLFVALLALLVGVPGAIQRTNLDDTSVLLYFKRNIMCSGTTVYSKGKVEWILTARHCYDDGGYPTYVRFFNEDIGLPNRAVIARENADLFLVRVTSKLNHPAASFTLVAPKRTESVWFVGAPDGTDWGFVTSYVMAPHRSIRYGNFAPSVVPLACIGCDSGMSGASGRNEDGKIVGVVTASNQSSTIGYMIPSRDVFPFIQRILHAKN